MIIRSLTNWQKEMENNQMTIRYESHNNQFHSHVYESMREDFSVLIPLFNWTND